jgi:hypothetical protein
MAHVGRNDEGLFLSSLAINGNDLDVAILKREKGDPLVPADGAGERARPPSSFTAKQTRT